MKMIRLKISTAIDMANWINDIAEKHSSDEIPYVEITSGDPSGVPNGSEFVEVKAPLGISLGDCD